jgi:hypothetical protein
MKQDISFYHCRGNKVIGSLKVMRRHVDLGIRDKRPVPTLSYAMDIEEQRVTRERRAAERAEREQGAAYEVKL